MRSAVVVAAVMISPNICSIGIIISLRANYWWMDGSELIRRRRDLVRRSKKES